MVLRGAYRTVLVVGADVLSDIVNQDDPKMAALFGDAACAAVLTRSNDPELGIITQNLASDGNQWAYIYQPRHVQPTCRPGSKNPSATICSR